MALDGDPLATIGTGDGVKLTIAHGALLRVKVGGDHIHTRGIATEDDLVSQLLGLQMKVKDRAIVIDD
ncbi:Uncharacterised protein [Chlamydia trachomatis]|nr:Uncharacterised protein [Chlamydia trachomatis]